MGDEAVERAIQQEIKKLFVDGVKRVVNINFLYEKL